MGCIKKIVALGDSITAGSKASSVSRCWVSLLTKMLEEAQGYQIELHNKGISGNVLTSQCPSYSQSGKPSALERVDDDVLTLQPDTILLAYGLNDSRGGTPPEIFRLEYHRLLDRILAQSTPNIVLLNTYYMRPESYSYYEHFDHSSYELTEVYNVIIKQIAEKYGLSYSDIYSSMVGVDWLIDEDYCHPNDLGHRVIANKVFETIIRNKKYLKELPNLL